MGVSNYQTDCSFPSTLTSGVRWRELLFEGGGEREGNESTERRRRACRLCSAIHAADDGKVTK